jgi:DNA-binding MarR family transcriptional regulator
MSEPVIPEPVNPDRGDRLAAVRVLARLSRLVERGTGELSLAHYRVLSAVAEGDERASRVAARLALGKPTISASVEALCRRGLLTREQASEDQRVATLRLTGGGQLALAEVEAALVTRMGALLDHVADPAAVLAALGQLGVGLDALADLRHGADGVAR